MEYLLILSDSDEASTDDVMDWLYYLKPELEIIRLTYRDHLLISRIIINDSEVDFVISGFYYDQKVVLQFSKIVAFWYRRGSFIFQHGYFTPKTELEREIVTSIFKFATEQTKIITDFIYDLIKCKLKSINSYYDDNTNKLINLRLARDCGLNIPDTIITSSGSELRDFCRKHETLLNKPLRSELNNFRLTNIISYGSNTVQVSSKKLEEYFNLEGFHPTMFQKYIDKKYEIRAFILGKQISAMAIFSQMSEKTKIDFRNYDYDRPNRTIPYQLPPNLSSALFALMRRLDFASGSVDLIYSSENKYYFLEVNPIGQFQWLSKRCNYFLEKKIAAYLIN